MRNTELDRQITDIRSFLSQNKNKLAINVLARLDLSQLPRENRLEVARLAREAGIPMTGIRLLDHVLREEGATPAEVVEYCGCLNDLGSVEESIRRLSKRDSSWPAEATYELGRAHLKDLSLGSAAALFEECLKLPNLDALVQRNSRRFLSQCYRMLGQFDKAIQILNGTSEFSFELKLAEILKRTFDSDKDVGLEELQKLREEAARVRSWELQREIDFYIANASKNEQLMHHLYFGTPSAHFRNRLRQASNETLKLPENYMYGVALATGYSRVFDLFKGIEDGDAGVKLKVGQVLHRLFVTLLSDFYGSISISRLHEKVFLGESFDPETSPSRVHQIVKRLKHWLKKSQIPITIDEQNGFYRIRFHDAYNVKLSLKHLDLPNESPLYVRLELALPGNDFSIKEAAQALGLSRRFARKILERAEHEGWVLMKGRGRTTRYEFHRKNQLPL